jgi:predicted MFS family arabinose efflux permease
MRYARPVNQTNAPPASTALAIVAADKQLFLTSAPSPIQAASTHGGLIALLAIAAFVIAGGIHYQSPMLVAIADEFAASAATAGWIPTLSFVGMLSGILLIVPLGDRFDKRRIILGQLAVLAAAQATMAIAPSIWVLAAGSFVTGICSSMAQLMIAIVADIAKPNERGRVVGTQLTALFVGILFARIVGGLIAEHCGWRFSYALSTAMHLALAPLLIARLPRTRTTTAASYRTLLWSVVRLLLDHRTVRRTVGIQFLLGTCYGGFWATVAPMLAAFHRLGPSDAGLIGIPGAAGILVARPAGRWMDRSGAVPVVATGVGCLFLAWVTLGFSVWSVAIVVAGAVLLDCGLRAAMVANQTLVNSAVPDSRARANTLFGAHVWAGNACGAMAASSAFAHFGWVAVCAICLSTSGAALAIHLYAARSAGQGDEG